MLSPKTSMIRKLYKSYVHPFTQVVCGIPETWDSDTAAISLPFEIGSAVWSSCNRFIAISGCDLARVDILDSATLQRLQTLEFSQEMTGSPTWLIFSPDTKMLTWLGQVSLSDSPAPFMTSWDLHTGQVVSTIKLQTLVDFEFTAIAYSTSGKAVAVLHSSHTWYSGIKSIISIYNPVSGMYMHDAYQSMTPLYGIWTHGESLQMAIAGPATITIQEVGFVPGDICVEVETLSIPGNINDNLGPALQTQFLPTSHRLALVYDNRPICKVLVWTLQDPKCLLYHINIDPFSPVTFSSDGHFFTYQTHGAEVYIWKETSTGYTVHAKLQTSNMPYLSPNGELLATVGSSAVQLWHVKKISTGSSNFPTKVPHTEDFLMDFFLNRPLAVFAQLKDQMVTVLNLKSGHPQLTIATSMGVYGLRIIKDSIVVIGDRKAITWNLPGGNVFPDGRMDVEDSIQTVNFGGGGGRFINESTIAASMSLDFHYIAILRNFVTGGLLHLHDASRGQWLACAVVEEWGRPLWFTPDGIKICYALCGKGVEVVTITCDSLPGDPIMIPPTDIEAESWGCPWGTSSGYQVTDDGWVLGADRKRLLMLPPPWQSYTEKRVWNGRFLALLHGTLSEPVILELVP